MIHHVSQQDKRRAFAELGIWIQIKQNALRQITVVSKQRENGRVSQILKHFNADGSHIATTHRVLDVWGNVLHWDEKDLVLPSGDKLCCS